MKEKQIIAEIESLNNTKCRLINNEVYIDSMKQPHVFIKLGQKLNFMIVTVNQPTDLEVLGGDRSSGFKVNDVEFNCYAMKVIIF